MKVNFCWKIKKRQKAAHPPPPPPGERATFHVSVKMSYLAGKAGGGGQLRGYKWETSEIGYSTSPGDSPNPPPYLVTIGDDIKNPLQ